jgi:hypothetical protein
MLILVGYIAFIAVSWVAVGIGNLTGGDESASPATTNPLVTIAATSPATTSPPVSTSSIEYKMAVVDGDSSPSASLIGRYERAMSAAVSNCPQNSKQQIADMSVRSTQLLADSGVSATALEMVEALNQSISDLEAGDCTDVFAALIVLMTNG